MRVITRQELRFFPFAEPALESRSGPKGSRMTLVRLVILSKAKDLILLRVDSAKGLRTGSVKDLWQTDPLPKVPHWLGEALVSPVSA